MLHVMKFNFFYTYFNILNVGIGMMNNNDNNYI